VNGNHVFDFGLVLMVYMWYLSVNGNHVSDFGLVLMVYMWYLAVNGNHVSDFGPSEQVQNLIEKLWKQAKWIALPHITDHFPDLVQAFK
jgi:hypothetical protein